MRGWMTLVAVLLTLPQQLQADVINDLYLAEAGSPISTGLFLVRRDRT